VTTELINANKSISEVHCAKNHCWLLVYLSNSHIQRNANREVATVVLGT